MVNPILQMLQSGNQQNPQNNIMMQAIGAMMRGESPQQFLQNLAKNDPRLQGLDLQNIDKTAEEVCKTAGRDYNTEKQSIFEKVNQFINNK